ncbi:MAG: aminotransferase class V-fold PLP-dependent enzyme [Armatimonadetes bacterium]|nr:aminotransferase class V-fold PLP-dependent enzyme [Armatimonadota bacterium]
MKILEDPLEDRLIQYVSTRPDLRLLGPNQSGKNRQPTFSLTHDRMPSQVLARELQARGLWVRHGNMYAWRLCEALGLDPEDGVLRISAVHTNTPEEIERVCEALDQFLPNVS